MKRNSLYIIISIITILSLFITAATCNFCGMQLDTVSSEEESEKEDKEETESRETEEDKETVAEETAEQTEEEGTSEENAEESDEQTSDETSEESAVEDIEEADEETSEDTGEDDIGVIGEAMMMQTDRLSIIGSRSGYLSNSGDVSGVIYAGDDEEHNYYEAFLCFDISGLTGVDITSAQLEIPNIRKFGEPSDWGDTKVYFFEADYGGSLSMDDWHHYYDRLFILPVDGLGQSLTQTSENIVSTIQEAIDNGHSWYQMMIGLGGNVGESDDDDEKDGYRFSLEGLVLEVNYWK